MLTAFACTTRTEVSPLDDAELAFENGDYDEAQEICDSLALGTAGSSLSVDRMCRLSLLLLRLGESYGNEESNIALAANSFLQAKDRNADSVEMFTATLPVEDRARLSLLRAISEAHFAPAITDTIDYEDLE